MNKSEASQRVNQIINAMFRTAEDSAEFFIFDEKWLEPLTGKWHRNTEADIAKAFPTIDAYQTARAAAFKTAVSKFRAEQYERADQIVTTIFSATTRLESREVSSLLADEWDKNKYKWRNQCAEYSLETIAAERQRIFFK